MVSVLDKKSDAIIVGTGPGGGSVANELSRKGWRLLILEKGHGEPIKGTIPQMIKTALIPGRSMHFTQQLLGLIHGVAWVVVHFCIMRRQLNPHITCLTVTTSTYAPTSIR